MTETNTTIALRIWTHLLGLPLGIVALAVDAAFALAPLVLVGGLLVVAASVLLGF